jgi:hypothetical protein
MIQTIFARFTVMNSTTLDPNITTALHATINTFVISIPVHKDYKLNVKKLTLECNDRTKMDFVYVANERNVNDIIYCILGALDATLSRFCVSGFTYATNKQVNIISRL